LIAVNPQRPVRGVRKAGKPAHVRELWHFAQRNRWLAFGVPLVTVLATAAFVSMVTPVYESAAWIRVDEERSGLPVLDALGDMSSGSQLGTEAQVLRRRPLAEAVIDSLSLQLALSRPRNVSRSEVFLRVDVSRAAPEAEYRFERGEDGRFTVRSGGGREIGRFAAGERIQLDGAVVVLSDAAGRHEEIRVAVSSFRETLKSFERATSVLRPDREANILVVVHQGTDPHLVRDVPNTMSRLFIAHRQSERKTEARSTIDFLADRIGGMEVELRGAEDLLREFREREGIVSLGEEARSSLQRMAAVQAERDLLDAERSALAIQLAEVQAVAAMQSDPAAPSPYRRLIAFPTLLRNVAMSELFRSLGELDNERAQLLNMRTEIDSDVLVLTGRIRELETQVRTIAENYLEGLGNQVASIDGNLALFRTDLQRVPAREIEVARRTRRADVLDDIFRLLQTRLQEAQIAEAIDDPTVRIVEPAMLPIDPIRPRKRLSVLLALMAGMTAGIGLAFVRESLDGTFHTREELQTLIGDVPVLGTIPRIRESSGFSLPFRSARPARNGTARLAPRLIAGRDPRSPVSEAYRSMRTNIAFAMPDRMPKLLVFTSPTPGDGKSTSAANFAITMAQQELRCLLIDADLRRGFLHEVFGIDREPGLSEVLRGTRRWEDSLQRVALGESGAMDFMATGPLPPNPAELLSPVRVQPLLAQLGAAYDVVILDAPPLTLVTDAALIGTCAEGVILVARAGATTRGAVEYAMEQLANVRAPVIGALLNDVDQRLEQYYGSYSAGAHADYYGAAASR
jgi:capsular exopolysaccharide synthesis family protein